MKKAAKSPGRRKTVSLRGPVRAIEAEILAWLSNLFADYFFEIRVDKNGEIHFHSASEGFFRHSGHTMDEVRTPEQWLKIVHPDDALTIMPTLSQILATGKSADVSYRYYHGNGSLRWAHIMARGIMNRRGKVTRIVAAVRDVTEQRDVELALRQNEQYYRRLIETQYDVVALLDRKGTVRYMSPSTERFSGFKPEELIGTNAFDILHPGDIPEALSSFSELLKKPGLRPPMELRFRRKDGSYAWVESTVNNLLDDPAVRAIVVCHHDLTERKKDEEERQRLQEGMLHAQKMEVMGQLAGGVAHDFNNLLQIILSTAEVLERGLHESNALKTCAEEIQNAAKKATVLTQQLLALSRKKKPQPCETDVNDLILRSFRMIHVLLGKSIPAEVRLDPNAGRAFLDPAQMEQALLNLAANSRDAMPRGGRFLIETRLAPLTVKPCVDASQINCANSIEIRVSDSGKGISPEIRDRIFDPFFTTKEEGTGLGLSIVRRIVEQNNGQIEVDSLPGSNTVFRLVFPRIGSAHQLDTP